VAIVATFPLDSIIDTNWPNEFLSPGGNCGGKFY
jgi:hypothetical protein